MKKRSSDEIHAIDAAIEAVVQAPSNNFLELVALAGLDRQRDFRFANLEDVDFAGMDLHGFDFSGANLRNAKFHGSKIAEATFSNDATRFKELKQSVDWAELAIFSAPARKPVQRSSLLGPTDRKVKAASREERVAGKQAQAPKLDNTLSFDELIELADRLLGNKSLREARTFYETALASAQSEYGDRSPKHIFALQRLADCTERLRDIPNTRKLLRRATAVAEDSAANHTR